MKNIKLKILRDKGQRGGMAQLEAELREWWEEEGNDWDALVSGTDDSDAPGANNDLYDDMPVIDSKAVARTSAIFEKNLGIPLDTKLIRLGGYATIEEMMADLFPKMEKVMQERAAAAKTKGATKK